MDSKQKKAIKVGQEVISNTIGVVAGIGVAVVAIGYATTLTGKIIGGAFVYAFVAGASSRAVDLVTAPIVKHLNKEDDVSKEAL
jgi:hypothetical protein